MNQILESVAHHAKCHPEQTALQSGSMKITYADLQKKIWKLATVFIESEIKILGLYLDNGIDWVLVDLASQCAGITLIPLPAFFSAGQIEFIFRKANIDAVIGREYTIIPDSYGITITRELAPGVNLYKCKRCPDIYNSLKQTGKITFTSGTTGYPKGVCLTNEAISRVAGSLSRATSGINIEKHLSVLPLSTLLENIAGVYAPLLKGAVCQLPSLSETGLTGATRFDVVKLIDCVRRYQPHSMILLPQMLHDLVTAAGAGVDFPDTLKFIAVGGGVISPSLIKKARAYNLPVYEGYGLSECGSVVALNTPHNDLPGSAGKILDNIEIRLADDNEIMLKGNFMQGYLGGPAINSQDWLATGDAGKIDESGFLHITGRKKNIFITSFGRNVSPEWTESELTVLPAIKKAVVFGEARPVNCAVIVPADHITDEQSIENAIAIANRNLPDYARVYYWVKADEDFTLNNGLVTANGRPVRERIYRIYEKEIESCYQKLLISGSA